MAHNLTQTDEHMRFVGLADPETNFYAFGGP